MLRLEQARRRARRPGERLAADRRTRAAPGASRRCWRGSPRPAAGTAAAGSWSPATGALLVGTGDAAVGTNPRRPEVARRQDAAARPDDGPPWPGNPFVDARNKHKRYVLHLRPPQRAGPRPAPRRHALVGRARLPPRRRGQPAARRRRLRLAPGAGLQREVPMTDQSLPGPQVDARWSSGDPTVATSGATWVVRRAVGPAQRHPRGRGAQGEPGRLHEVRRRGRLKWTVAPQRLRQLGRLRSVTPTPGRRPAHHHRQRRRRRRGPPRQAAGSAAPVEEGRTPGDGREPDRRQPDGEPRQPVGWGVHHRTAPRRARAATADQRQPPRTTGWPARWRRSGTARTPCRPSRRTATARPSRAPSAAGGARHAAQSSSSSFQRGSLSHSSLRSSAFSRAREASSRVAYGPSRSTAAQVARPRPCGA